MKKNNSAVCNTPPLEAYQADVRDYISEVSKKGKKKGQTKGTSKNNGRKKKNDIPDFARGQRPKKGDKNPRGYARRLCEENAKREKKIWDGSTHPKSDFNQIKKDAENRFMDYFK